MKLFRINHLFLALSLLCVNNTQPMEWKPGDITAAGITLIGGILLGKIAMDQLWKQEPFPLFELPQDMRMEIIALVTTGATSNNLKETGKAINTLTLVNKDLNNLINDKKFTMDLLKHLTNRFNCTEEEVCKALQTKTAKEMYQHNLKNVESCWHLYTLQSPIDPNFRFTNIGQTLQYPDFIPLLPGGGNLLMCVYYFDHPAQDSQELNNTVNVNVTNTDGKNVLMLCAEYRGSYSEKRSIVRKILKKFPNININQQDMDGNTALLLSLSPTSKIKVERQGTFGRLQKATILRPRYIEPTTIKILLDAGADPEIANNEGLTPLQAAQNTGNQRIIQMIRDAINTKHSSQ